jgi:formylglycine-generating enzyme required for sulfatase activity
VASSVEPLPGHVFKDSPDAPEMVVVPAGRFLMGSAEGTGDSDERPQHEVVIARPFAVGRYAVTFDEWDACVTASGLKHRPDDAGWGCGRQPVINVSWEDSRQYVGWLSKHTGQAYRLLSEAEWEYAARAGTSTRYRWGDEPGTNRANFVGSGSRWSGERTAPVGSFEPNGFGLYEMNGNVWEWVQDCWNESYRGAPSNGSAWEAGVCGRRVVRGGSWYNAPGFARSAYRFWFEPGVRDDYLGFRVARTL